LGRRDPSAKRLRCRAAFNRAPVHSSPRALPAPDATGSLREQLSPCKADEGEKT
jgi:hypothetical protein